MTRNETANIDAVAAMDVASTLEQRLQSILNRAENAVEGNMDATVAVCEIAAIGRGLGYITGNTNTGELAVLEPTWLRRTLSRGRTQSGWRGSESWNNFVELEMSRADNMIDGVAVTVGVLKDSIIPLDNMTAQELIETQYKVSAT